MSSSRVLRPRTYSTAENTNMSELRDEIAALRAEVKELLHGQKEVSSLVRSLKEECNSLRLSCAKKDEKISLLELRVDELEQINRQDDIVITGLKTTHKSWARAVDNTSVENNADAPLHETESLEKQVIQFFTKQDITVCERDISVAHSFKTPHNNKSIIIMKMSNRRAKTNILKHGKNLKGTDVYVNEHLTRKNSELYRIARLLKRNRLIKFTFTRNCKVFARTNGVTPEDESTVIVRNLDDLIKLGYTKNLEQKRK